MFDSACEVVPRRELQLQTISHLYCNSSLYHTLINRSLHIPETFLNASDRNGHVIVHLPLFTTTSPRMKNTNRSCVNRVS
ncbi:hypothetical protein BD410DRAFT_306236 [Rickenella mellea]|uniref:Uncharacterized protein n=1 Tax=Rickenella mellea TaxID=50990 RepID=A0A4Y7Q3S0_9AGAM|nr:hypothetical protein BD410DRAFT_306236 [Rickenella mellea]